SVELPRTRGPVVVAERLAERGTEAGIGVEGVQRALQRAWKRWKIGPLRGVADDRLRWCGAAPDPVGGGRGKRGQGEVRVGVGAGAAALDPPALTVLAADRAYGAGAVLQPPADVDGREPPGHEPFVGIDRRVQQQRG